MIQMILVDVVDDNVVAGVAPFYYHPMDDLYGGRNTIVIVEIFVAHRHGSYNVRLPWQLQ
jgi:hypothetical protein